jgi:isoquinoline 1-oxidoreductase subunit alpha
VCADAKAQNWNDVGPPDAKLWVREQAMITITVNQIPRKLDLEPDMPLLWVLRDELGLTGTKYGCGIGQCGACTVHVDGEAVRSCITRVSDIAGKKVATIEGLGRGKIHPVQEAWILEQVPQCGYCQSGQIMAAAALLAKQRSLTDEEVKAAMTNICRCGTYPRILKALRRAARLASG